jgi:predicted nuclease of predicted toxin-antitoxin system
VETGAWLKVNGLGPFHFGSIRSAVVPGYREIERSKHSAKYNVQGTIDFLHMRCILDENLSPQLAARLNTYGHDTLCAYDAGLCGKSDLEIREFAIQQNRVLITFDSDFGDLTRYPVSGTPGVVWLKPEQPITLLSIEQQLLRAMQVLQSRDLHGLLIIVSSGRIRSRTGV